MYLWYKQLYFYAYCIYRSFYWILYIKYLQWTTSQLLLLFPATKPTNNFAITKFPINRVIFSFTSKIRYIRIYLNLQLLILKAKMFTFLFKVTTPACNVCEQFKSESCYAACRQGQEQLKAYCTCCSKGTIDLDLVIIDVWCNTG